jgi:hypothetical protein
VVLHVAEGFLDAADQGYSIYQGVWQRTAISAVIEELDRAELVRTRAGARHVLSVPAVRAVALEPAMLDIAAQYLGDRVFPFRATLFNKSAMSNWLVAWHQDTALPVVQKTDTPGWGPWSRKGGVLHAIATARALGRVVALRVHLDDSTRDNGPLRVLPGTQTFGILRREQIEQLAMTLPAHECLVDAGGVVALRPLTVHASSKARSDQPRRVLHIEFASTIILDVGIELAVA